MRILLIVMLMGILSGCGASVYKYIKNEETGKLEVVEKYTTSGAGKIEAEFGTGGKITSDTGLKVPVIPINRN